MELIDKKVTNSSIKMGRWIVANYILLELDLQANILYLNDLVKKYLVLNSVISGVKISW
jgi:hypothetical protein